MTDCRFKSEPVVIPYHSMARAPYLQPTVFVGCPYKSPFKFKAFRDALNLLPFSWYYADTRLHRRYLLPILTTYIKAVDYCLFDLSLWNPNVSLELGLAEGDVYKRQPLECYDAWTLKNA